MSNTASNQSHDISKENFFLCTVAAHDDWKLWNVSRTTVIITAVVNSLFAPVATLTNILVLATISRTPSIRKPSNVLLGCLLLTDFFVGVIVQPQTVFENVYRSSSCSIQLAGSLIEYTVTCVSFTTITVIAIEKYITLFHPLFCESYVTTRRALFLSVFIWIFWILMIPLRIFWSNKIYWALLGVAWGCGVITSSIIYVKIVRLIQYHKRRIRREQQNADVDSHPRRKSAITMGYIIGVLLVCYIPLGAVLFYQKTLGETKNMLIAEAWCETLFYITSSLNPLIYWCRSEEMRRAIALQLTTLKTFCSCH